MKQAIGKIMLKLFNKNFCVTLTISLGLIVFVTIHFHNCISYIINLLCKQLDLTFYKNEFLCNLFCYGVHMFVNLCKT